MRTAVIVLACAAFAFSAQARARAAAEFCPATVVGGFTQVGPSSFRFRLGAISERKVSGFIRFQTENGWYNAPFTHVPFTASTKMYDDEGMTFSHADYVSDDMVVRFPAAQQHVLYGYVSQAQTSGETVLDWDKQGSVTCLPTSRDAKPKAPAAAPSLPPLSKTAIALAAKPIDSPFTQKCGDPFESVQLAQAPRLQMPALFGRDDFTARPAGTSAVVVAVDQTGGVVDEWLWETSGTPLLDNAVLAQAAKSTFRPGRAFCENVPGYFLLRTEFKS
jgi:hypothetical protein